MKDVTKILGQIEHGDPTAAEDLLPILYEELRKLAAAKLAHEKPGHTLQATALVHEAFMRLVDRETVQHWNSRGHFFAAAAEAMRRILVESARRKQAVKSVGSRKRFSLEEADLPELTETGKLLVVNDALERLAAESSEAAELVKLRVFAGLTVNESALALDISRTTAYRHWTYARAWLRVEFADEG